MPSEETSETPPDPQVGTNYIQQGSTSTFVQDVSWEVYVLVRDALRGNRLRVQDWQRIREAQHASPDRSIRYQGHLITAKYLDQAEAGLLLQDPPQQPWVQEVTLHEAKRQTNSRDGNPRWMLTYSVGSTDDNLITVYTEPDAQFALNDLTALVGFKVQLSIVHNRAINVRPLSAEGDPELFGNDLDKQRVHYLQQMKKTYQKQLYIQVPDPEPRVTWSAGTPVFDDTHNLNTGRFFTP